ncbi:DNA polymerase III subunit epsilon [Polystyrenella longa]|uniref:DNA polymerase III subunit epsilon n=1 Tax=Polystyrenella longa TaxID=2528007 RepID=A0A518CKJ0_9PLAN|nr:tetratricopeptide repeat protein [Polystyrenella longa]QDU79736.1 DNA polymerase III subunit epsilon [Polystyrenella longa]
MSEPEHPSPEPLTPEHFSDAEIPLPESSPPLQGERIAFTGTLASMTHQQAFEMTEQQGGTATQHLGRQNTMLVVGEEGWPLEEDGQPSVKIQEAADLLHIGHPLRILQESEWLQLIELQEPDQESHKLYTPAMLHKALDVSVNQIRAWERRGLIKAVKKVYRLPYFDFQQVAGVRRLLLLLNSGISPTQIESGLRKLESIFPNVDRPLAQLELLVHDHHLLLRDGIGLLEPASGQRFFEFNPSDEDSATEDDESTITFPTESDQDKFSSDNPDVLFQESCRALDSNQLDQALWGFRQAIQLVPTKAEFHFHLAETLYRQNNLAGAIERYHTTVEHDPYYLEAWTQLGCLYAEQNRHPEATRYFQAALALHPDYPDAIYHLAEVLQQLGRHSEAASHWQTYLHLDSRGPWAENARQSLQQWEEQIKGE